MEIDNSKCSDKLKVFEKLIEVMDKNGQREMKIDKNRLLVK